jgi:alkylhydroperoxidase family enzyme
MSRVRRRNESNIEAMRNRVLEGPGVLDVRTRQAIYRGEGPADLALYLDKVRNHAYLVTDAEVEALKKSGRSDDEIYEATVAAAMGAGMSRLDAVMRLMDEEG